ncbi:uncharacterized protein LOC141639785 [Silene latifolia]|uniref:uncharacterized protein LOC141639785 n=1 Tax=Silene latifolia TaxID=37657 RepID=UPI003D770C8F
MNKITSICRNYLWSGSSDYKKVPNISWSTCCLPKDEGGLGIKEAKVWNKALLGKYVWWLAKKKDHLWVKWVSNIYMKGIAWTDYKALVDCSWSWKKLTHIMDTLKQAYTNNNWLNTTAEYTVYAGYDWLRVKEPAIDWNYVCWNPLNIPKCTFIFWEFMHHKLPTKDRLIRMGLTIDQTCDICASQPETMIHVFYECEYGKLCTRLLQQALHCKFRLQDLNLWYSKGRGATKLERKYIGACHVALVYWLWRMRNEARMEACIRRPEHLVSKILSDVKTRFLKVNVSMLLAKDRSWFQSL